MLHVGWPMELHMGLSGIPFYVCLVVSKICQLMDF